MFPRPMPILRGTVTFARYHVGARDKKRPSDVRRWFVKALQSQVFEPIDRKTDEERSVGFAELENPTQTEFSTGSLFFGERALFTWRVDQLKVSAALNKEELAVWEQNFVKENDRKPAKSERSTARAEIRDMLRKKARPVTKTHDVAWNLKTEQLQIWTSSRKVVDEIAGAIETAFEVKLTALSPGAIAERDGLKEDSLLPTASLVGPSLEVAHGA
jgi:recombination associated protein RdgC